MEYYDFPPVKRVITGHDEQGQSTTLIVEDAIMEPFIPGSDDPTKLTRFWMTRETPANNDDQKTDFKNVIPERFGFIQPNGSQACMVDLPPRARYPNHRTSSIDYVILISGAVTLFLDTDEPGKGTTIDVPGSVVVQRGTHHSWENPSTTEWARYVAVMIDAKPVEVEVEKEGGRKEVEVLKEGFLH
ncbi:hypothetical protein DL93DRAFT_2159258 [Clavulina sp. PMI_390]|nr:hypothetical protein DL93DRAFT_2159258 [Clavulina sp. PMI_390]